MKGVLFLCSVLLGFSVAQKSPDCPDTCDLTACTAISELRCIAETTHLDRCGCCTVCSKILDERCGGEFWEDGRCGADYICAGDDSPTTEVSIADGETGLCKCRSFNERVCGTDDVLYPHVCALNIARRRNELSGQRAITRAPDGGRCEYAPMINTRPKDTAVYIGQQVYLSCEVEGNPIPDVTWYRVDPRSPPENRREKMPGYRNNISVQIRGGQGKHRGTSWLMIETTESDAGVYQCHAKNKEGEVHADATVSISTRPAINEEEGERPANQI